MLRIRVVTPSDRSERVLGVLTGHDGVTDVVRFAGAAVDPAGDVVDADVAREAADGVLDALHALPAGCCATVTLSVLDTALGAPVEHARAAAPGAGDDAVVWDQLAESTGEGSSLSASFLLFIVVATLIGAIGVMTDSQVLIVGAMVLGPEFGPLAGIAVGLVRRRWSDCLASVRAVGVGFPLAIAVTAGFVALLDAAGLVPDAYLRGQLGTTSFVSAPDVFSVVVALLAGIAGTVSLTAAKSSALVGVFISVTTIPAAAQVGAALVTGQPGQAGGAAAQLVLNLACILAAAVVTLTVQRVVWRRVVADPERRRAAVRRRAR